MAQSHRIISGIGASVFALGLGLAVANEPGVASATPSAGTASASTDSTSSTSRTSAGPRRPAARTNGISRSPRTSEPSKLEAATSSTPLQQSARRATATAALSPSRSASLDGPAVTPAVAVGPSTNTPAAPTQPGPLRALLESVAAARRQILGVLINRAPTPVATGPAVQLPTGTIIGAVRAVDADGDPLTYTIGQAPSHGEVTIDADGSYSYVPNAGFTGTDAFTVAVDDNHRALLQVDTNGVHPDLFNGTGRTTVPVSLDQAGIQSEPVKREFLVVNLTTKPLVFRGYASVKPEGSVVGPVVGAVLQPGATHTYVAYWDFFKGNTVFANYSLPEDTTTAYQAKLQVASVFSVQSVGCSVRAGSCLPAPDIEPIFAGTVTFLDAPNTNIVVPPEQSQARRDILLRVCSDDSKAVCSFTPTSPEQQVLGDVVPVGSRVINETAAEQSFQLTAQDQRSETNSVTLQVKLGSKLSDLLNLEFQSQFGRSWTLTRTFSQQVTLKVPPKSVGWVTSQAPVLRVRGDFTVRLGNNSTIVLKDVYFDTPDPSRAGQWTIRTELLTATLSPDEQDQLNSLPTITIDTNSGANATMA